MVDYSCHCHLSFLAIDIERIVELPDNPPVPHSMLMPIDSSPVVGKNSSVIEFRDINHFRQVVGGVLQGQMIAVIFYDPLFRSCWGSVE